MQALTQVRFADRDESSLAPQDSRELALAQIMSNEELSVADRLRQADELAIKSSSGEASALTESQDDPGFFMWYVNLTYWSTASNAWIHCRR